MTCLVDFDADDPLAGIPLSDEEEDFGVPAKKPAPKRQKSSENLSPRNAAATLTETKGEIKCLLMNLKKAMFNLVFIVSEIGRSILKLEQNFIVCYKATATELI